MEYYWLNKSNCENLIIFFCGWSFDYKPFERLSCQNYDVICIYDYENINNVYNRLTIQPLNPSVKNLFPYSLISLFPKYRTSTLITWSMGVYVAYLLKDILPKFDTKIAITGTPYPIHDECGIPVKTFDLTLKYVDTGLQGKFQKNLFKTPEEYEKYIKTPVKRTIENQKAELIALNDFIKNKKIGYEKFYDCAIISDTDKIIPTRNQKNCWEKFGTPYKILDSGHFPFFNFNSWEDIIKCKQTLGQ